MNASQGIRCGMPKIHDLFTLVCAGKIYIYAMR